MTANPTFGTRSNPTRLSSGHLRHLIVSVARGTVGRWRVLIRHSRDDEIRRRRGWETRYSAWSMHVRKQVGDSDANSLVCKPLTAEPDSFQTEPDRTTCRDGTPGPPRFGLARFAVWTAVNCKRTADRMLASAYSPPPRICGFGRFRAVRAAVRAVRAALCAGPCRPCQSPCHVRASVPLYACSCQSLCVRAKIYVSVPILFVPPCSCQGVRANDCGPCHVSVPNSRPCSNTGASLY